MDERNEKQFHRRAMTLVAMFALCLLCFGWLLYDAQVVHHQDYLKKSTTQVTTTRTVETTRGILTDRNGKVLVSNKELYAITFDKKKVPAVKGEDHDVNVSRAILRLIRLCQEQGVTWTDTLPLTAEAPFSYTTPQATGAQRSRFQRYLKSREWSDTELTAESPYPTISRQLQEELGSGDGMLPSRTLLQLMRKDFGVDPAFTDQEARLVLGVLYELELRTFNNGKDFYIPPYTFAEDVSVELISILNDGAFQGVTVSSRSVRQFNTDRAAHILGFTGAISSKEEREALNAGYNDAKAAGADTSPYHYYALDDTVGKQGAERAFESYLRGKDGKQLITTDEHGKITSELYSIEPQPGGTVALTIDIDLQAQVEDCLAQAVEAMNAEDGSTTRGAAAVVVSVQDSDVLAMASYPTYDLASYGENLEALNSDPATPLVNRALQGAYAPGSTFKPITAVAALESGVISPTTKLLTKGKYTYYPDYQPACWIYRQYGGSHGKINVSEAIYHSCNYFFYEVGRLTGIDALNQFASGFGLGQPTGIELGERTGILDGPDYRAEAGSLWTGGSVLQCSIGQGDTLTTPLQLANYVATLVRGGERYDAHLLKSVTTYDGSQTLYESQPEAVATVEMSPSTLAAVKKGMGDLTTTGSVSKYFQDCVVSAGAKTGSAQTGEKVANGVFVCFAPFDEPEVAVAIVIEQGGSGAALASTAVNILNACFAPSDIGTALLPEGTLLP